MVAVWGKNTESKTKMYLDNESVQQRAGRGVQNGMRWAVSLTHNLKITVEAVPVSQDRKW